MNEPMQANPPHWHQVKMITIAETSPGTWEWWFVYRSNPETGNSLRAGGVEDSYPDALRAIASALELLRNRIAERGQPNAQR